MITIKHRFSGATICEFDVATIREVAEKGKARFPSNAEVSGGGLPTVQAKRFDRGVMHEHV